MCCVDLVVISNKGVEETFWVLVEAFTMINPQGAIFLGGNNPRGNHPGSNCLGIAPVGQFSSGQFSSGAVVRVAIIRGQSSRG